jgi:hypothetical protein
VDYASWPQEYVQCAGSADRLTVEVRRATTLGGFVHEVIGRRGVFPGEGVVRDQEVRWDDYCMLVAEEEILTAADATDVFVAYFHEGDLPLGF